MAEDSRLTSSGRCAFPLNQLRINGLLQSAIIATVLATKFHHTPPRAPVHTWAWIVGAYGLVAAVFPWLTGGFIDEEFEVRLAALLGIFFALPASLAFLWLRGTPYRWIGMSYGVLIAAWFLFLLLTIVRELRAAKSDSRQRTTADAG